MSDPIRAWALVWADGDLCRITAYEGDAIASARTHVGLNIVPLVECTEHRRALTSIAEFRLILEAKEAAFLALFKSLKRTRSRAIQMVEQIRLLRKESNRWMGLCRSGQEQLERIWNDRDKWRELCQTTENVHKTCNNCAEPYRYSKALKSNEPMIQVCRHAHRGNWSVCSKWKEQNEKSST